MNKEQFILKAREVHGWKYDYSKVEYKNNSTPVCIICPEHGEFWQTPKSHITMKYGCKQCGRKICAKKTSNTTKSFIEKARKIHGDKYDYSKVEYVNAYTKICIICPEHGEFYQTPHDHLKGASCPKCGNIKRKEGRLLSTDKFIEKAKKIHGDKYDYSKVNYVGTKDKICIICPEHGEFYQTPNAHLNGQGCPICGNKIVSEKKKKETSNLISQFIEKHGDKYDYSKVNYLGCDKFITIICPIHGEFRQRSHDHLYGHGCPKCGIRLSIAENEIYEYCKSLYPLAEQSNRSMINPYELDIYIPEINVAIEYNGLLWHSEKYKDDKNYHLKKLNACKEKGIKLLQIFEDEYVNNKEIVFDKLKHILKKCENQPKIMGRKCEVKQISKKESEEFLNKYHIQGFAYSTYHFGAFYNDELIAVMSFKEEKKGLNKWELTRFASNSNYVCQGVGGKLFNYFIKNYNPLEIKSFADRRWTINEENNIYLQLGFKFDSYTAPDYRYFKISDGVVRQHKFGFRKNILHKKYGLPLTMSETEMTEKLGYVKVYDCGLIKYVWKNA